MTTDYQLVSREKLLYLQSDSSEPCFQHRHCSAVKDVDEEEWRRSRKQ
jgi:hypothetical protein